MREGFAIPGRWSKAKLQHPGSGERQTVAEPFCVGRGRAEIPGGEGRVRPSPLHRLEELRSGCRHKLAAAARGPLGGELPVLMLSAEIGQP